MNKLILAAAAALMLIGSSLSSARADDNLNGTWAVLNLNGETRLEVSWTNGHGSDHESTLRPVDVNALGIAAALASAGEHVRFALHREAGDYAMEGWVGSGKGGGTYSFPPNVAFFQFLRSRGYTIEGPENELAAADLDITHAYVDELARAGVALDFQQLISFRALNIDGAYIKDMSSLGFAHLDAEQLVSMKALHIDRTYVEGMRTQGVTDLTAHNVVELKALHVDANYMQELAAGGYPHLSAHDYVQLKALHVDGAYLKRLASHGLNHLTVEQIVNYKALGIQ